MAPHLSSPMIQADRLICKDVRVVLWCPENTTRGILAKTGNRLTVTSLPNIVDLLYLAQLYKYISRLFIVSTS